MKARQRAAWMIDPARAGKLRLVPVERPPPELALQAWKRERRSRSPRCGMTPSLIAQKALQGLFAARLDTGAIGHEVRTAGGAYRVALRLARLLRGRRSERQRQDPSCNQ
jgi:hypothetical protein